MLAEWSESDAEGQVRDKCSSSGESVLGAPGDPGESWEVLMRRKIKIRELFRK